ncbi:MAG: hypothetical protein Q7S85_00900 [Rugosibacter sp.]|nr:hypothetical protein [Rugosibacter sp.]
MARYKHIDTSPRLIAVDLERQLLPGTFERALNYLIDQQLDLSCFDARYKNDLTGATAYAQQGNRGKKTRNPQEAGRLL